MGLEHYFAQSKAHVAVVLEAQTTVKHGDTWTPLNANEILNFDEWVAKKVNLLGDIQTMTWEAHASTHSGYPWENLLEIAIKKGVGLINR